MTPLKEASMENESAMNYRILYHDNGYIRLEIPSLKSLSRMFLYMNFKKSPPFPIPVGIKDLHVNPIHGSMVIKYEPNDIDILKYVEVMSSDPEVKKVIRG